MWWAEGAEFKALGLANGAAVTSWPDEIGTLNATEAASGPTFVAEDAGLNDRPSVAIPGVSEFLRTATFSSVSTWQVIDVGYINTTLTADRYLGGFSSSGSSGWGSSSGGAWQLKGGTTLTGGTADNLAHLFRATNAALAVDETNIGTMTSSSATQIWFGRAANGSRTNCRIALRMWFNGTDPTAHPQWTTFLEGVKEHYSLPLP